MIKKLITITIFVVFFSSILKAEVIKDIVIEGNKRVSEETIKVYGDFKLNQDISENQVNQILNNLYETEFFENIEIEFKNNILKIVLKEYPIINQLILFGEPKKAYQKEIKKLIKSKEKKPFIKSFINNDIEIIKKLYSSLGYNFANVDVKMRQIDEESLDLVVNIDRGKKLKSQVSAS